MMRVGVEPVRIEGTRLAELHRAHAADGCGSRTYSSATALAEDLMQDTFLRLAGRLFHMRDLVGFRAYLRRTIVNLSNAHFRRKKFERRYLEGQVDVAASSIRMTLSTNWRVTFGSGGG